MRVVIQDIHGNYIVTIGKVDAATFNGQEYSKVAVGLAPTIWSPYQNPQLTTFAPSTTSLDTSSIAQSEEKSTASENHDLSFNINGEVYAQRQIEELLREDISAVFHGLDSGEKENKVDNDYSPKYPA